MDAVELVKSIVAPGVTDGGMVLFLGAGFSLGAVAIGGQEIPTSRAFAERLARRAGVPRDEEPPELQVAWALAQRKPGFREYLREQFLVNRYQPWQRLVYRFRWRKIYTTNVDDLLEKVYEELPPDHKREVAARFFNWTDPRPAQIRELDLPVVQLHGSVKDADAGLVFAEAEYARATVRPGDWIREAAFDLASVPCCLVGSRFRESDLQAATAQRAMELGDRTGARHSKSFIVLPSFSHADRSYYEAQGFEPVQLPAEAFFTALAEAIPVLEPQHSVLRRRHPHLAAAANPGSSAAAAWFARAFEHVPTALVAAKRERVIDSTFFDGASPLWPYLVRGVPAEFHAERNLRDAAESYLFKQPGEARQPCVLAVQGPTGAGKSTVTRRVLAHLAQRVDPVYLFRAESRIDADAVIDVVGNATGPMVLAFEQAAEFFQSINDVVAAIRSRGAGYRGRLLIIVEDRTHRLNRDVHHLAAVPPKSIPVDRLKRSDADALLDALERANYLGPLTPLSRQQRVERILDAEQGYHGDLLVALRTITTGKQLDALILDDLRDIEPRRPYLFACLAGLSGHPIRASDVCAVASIRAADLVRDLQGVYDGRLRYDATSQLVYARHPVIAQLHYLHGTEPAERCDDVVALLRLMSTHFNLGMIRSRPLEYRIYRELISRRLLQEVLLPKHPDLVERTYHELQSDYGHDGIFWLQFGKFYFRERRYALAEHCLRKGIHIFRGNADRESFQLHHALGQLLLQWHAHDPARPVASFEEGLQLLEEQVRLRGATDPYPYTTLVTVLIENARLRPETPRIRSLTEAAVRSAESAHPFERAIRDQAQRWRELVATWPAPP